jgi:hypothetical protein
MNPFPDLTDLARFFGCDPIIVGGPDEPWFYDTLRFVVVRNNDRIVCEIEPGEYIIRLHWYKEDSEILNVHVEGVYALQIVKDDAKESIHANISNNRAEGYFLLQLRPVIHVSLKCQVARY